MSETVENPSTAAGSQPLANEKWEAYCHSRAIHNSRQVAYQEAGFRSADAHAARGNGAKLERQHPEIRARIAYLGGQKDDVTQRIAAEIVSNYCAIMRVDIADYYNEVERPVLDKEGEPVIDPESGKPKTRMVQEIKPFSQMTPEQRFSISSLKYTDSGRPNLEFYPKPHAVAELRKMLNIGMSSRTDADEFSEMSMEELKEMAAREALALGLNELAKKSNAGDSASKV